MANLKTFRMSQHFVCCLINADTSGMSFEDIQALGDFCERNGIKHTLCPDDFETNFSRCQVTGLMFDCLWVECVVSDEVSA